VWKKNEPSYEPQSQPASPPARPSRSGQGPATIGPSITIKGDLTGEEDLLIQGKIEGNIILDKNSITVGKDGRIKADIRGRSIQVEGEVVGNLYGKEEVVIRASGRVEGNLIAPRVTLEDGSRFKGAIDMESRSKKSDTPPPPKKPQELKVDPAAPSHKSVEAADKTDPSHPQQTLQGSAIRR